MIIASLYPCPFDPDARHDANATLIKDEALYAYEEEKLTMIKREETARFSERSLMMGCKELHVLPSEIDIWVFPKMAKPVDLNEMFYFFSAIFKAYTGSRDDFPQWYDTHVYFVDHQLSHAAIAVFASGFKECAFLCQDGGGDSGDHRNLIFGEYKNGEFHVLKSDSGLLNICSYHGFLSDVIGFARGDNGKTSGLAAYGRVQPELLKRFQTLLTVQEDGILFTKKQYARSEVNLGKVRPFEYSRAKIFNTYPSDNNIFRMSLDHLPHDIAATGEYVLQKAFLDFLKQVKKYTSMDKIAFSGGLFLNVAINNKILESGIFNEIYIPMAAGDSGLSLGGALYIKNKEKKIDQKGMLTPLLGPSYDTNEIHALLDRFRLNYREVGDIANECARLIAEGNVVGWFQGRGEYGPRSLGNRSILADPRNARSKIRINQLLKKRDWFMPYAPSIMAEHLCEWVTNPHEAWYMQIAFKVFEEKRHMIPAAIHTDGSSRLHVVRREVNDKYWRLLDCFRKITGIPLVLNTSFNRHGISTISTPRQAIEHLLEGCMDYCALDDFLIEFSANRIVSASMPHEKEEDVCLAEDCIRRLKIVAAHATGDQVSEYCKNLSSLVGVTITLNGGKFLIHNKELPLGEAIDFLIRLVNSRVQCDEIIANTDEISAYVQ
ncbi:MAG: carbamoyltransferase C-terminal domain-containing protein [bacterium]